MDNHIVVGVDIAKHVFQVACSDSGKVVSNQRLSRDRFKTFLVKSKPCQIFMEACYSAHYWARFATQHGHEVGLIPAQHVAPFTRGNKNDANDAVAIIEASKRPGLRLVKPKSVEQQDIQSLHRLRERLVRNRTSLLNQTHGLLAEYGVMVRKTKKRFLLDVTEALNNGELSELIKQELRINLDELSFLSQRIKHIETQLKLFVEQNSAASILLSIPGIGLLNASALAAKYGDPNQFDCARDLAVHIGLTPRMVASGNRKMMLGISKRGDRYLRKQLIHGARALIMQASKRHEDAMCRWAVRVKQRRGYNVAVVALANRLARLVWTLLNKQEMYRAAP